jgi:Ni/Co efflux regulator RcnB
MKKFSATVCAIAAAALLTSSLSFAEGIGRQDEYQRGNGRGHDQGRDDRRDSRQDERQFDQRDGRWNDRRPDYNARGPDYRRGGYLAREYRGRSYEVDYREHHLRRPPEGHRWVQVGADYVLIAITTGIIASIILNQ